jgi:hypothetical protein
MPEASRGHLFKEIPMPQERTELTQRETERLDYVHNAIHTLICDLAGQEVEWDAEVIGDISDVVEEFVCDRLHIMPDHEFAPYIEALTDKVTA